MNNSLKNKVWATIKARIAAEQKLHDDEMQVLQDKHLQEMESLTQAYVDKILGNILPASRG